MSGFDQFNKSLVNLVCDEIERVQGNKHAMENLLTYLSSALGHTIAVTANGELCEMETLIMSVEGRICRAASNNADDMRGLYS